MMEHKNGTLVNAIPNRYSWKYLPYFEKKEYQRYCQPCLFGIVLLLMRFKYSKARFPENGIYRKQKPYSNA